jgi:hypothetical protein
MAPAVRVNDRRQANIVGGARIQASWNDPRWTEMTEP